MRLRRKYHIQKIYESDGKDDIASTIISNNE